jgi:hypothetical protein
MQRALNAAGARPPLVEDGLFGPKTEAALRRFQGAQGLGESAALDAATLGRLQPFFLEAPPPANDDFNPRGGSGQRAPRHDGPAPEGSVRAGDLARADEQRRRSPSPPAPEGLPPPQVQAAQPPAGPADARLADLQSRTMDSARRELAAGVRDRGGNRGERVDQYARSAGMPEGGAWCGYFTQFNYDQAARENRGRFGGALHSFEKARSFFGYRSYTDARATTNARLDALREQHQGEGSARRFMVLEGSSGQRWAERNNRPHEVFDPGTLPLRAGDTALFNRGHVGLVEGYDPRTGILTTIEGNAGGGQVLRREYDLNDPAVRARFEGFGRPALGDFGGR